MDLATLQAKMQDTNLLHRIMGNYVGHMRLGIFRDPANYRTLTFRLKVTWPDVSSFPTVIDVEGEKIPIKVEGGYIPTEPTNWLNPMWLYSKVGD